MEGSQRSAAIVFQNEVDKPIHLFIIEHLKQDYGLYLWPSSHVLTHYIWTVRDLFREKNVVELGAGVALPSLLASAVGAKTVVVTDNYDNNHMLLSNIEETLELNKSLLLNNNISTRSLRWGVFDTTIEFDHVDIILGSDVLYNTKDFEAVIATVAMFFQQNANAVFYTTYQMRSNQRSIGPLLEEYQMKATNLSLDFYPSPEVLYDKTMGDSSSSTSIYLIKIEPK